MRSKRSNVSLSFMGLVAIVFGVTFAAEAQLPDVIGRVTSLFGKPSIEAGGGRRKLDLGMGFSNRDRIATGYADAASLLLATNTVVKLDANSAARVVEEPARTNVALEYGTLEVFVANRTAAMGSVHVRDAGVTCEANHAVFWASYDAVSRDGYYACEDSSLILHGQGMDKPVTLLVNQSATFHNGKLVAVTALSRTQLAKHVHTLNGLARIAQRQGAEVAEERSRAVDVNVAMQQLIPGSVSRSLTASPQTAKALVARPTGSGTSTSDQSQSTATSTDTSASALPTAAPASAAPASGTPVLPAAATPSPVSLPPAAVPGTPISSAATVAPTPAAAAVAALPAVAQDVVNTVTTTPPTAAASAAANVAASIGTPVTVTPSVVAVPSDLATGTPTAVTPTPATPAAVAPTPGTPAATVVTGTTATPAAVSPTAVTPQPTMPVAVVPTPTSVTPATPTVDTSAAAVQAAATVAPAPTTPVATPVVAAAPTTVAPVPAPVTTAAPVAAAPTAAVAATPTAALVSSVSTLSASTPTAASTTASGNASVNSAIQSQSVASSVTAPAPAPQFDVTVLLDPGEHLNFNLVDATTGGAGANTVDVAVTAGGKTYLDSGQVNLTTAGQSFSPSVKPGAVQVQVDASSANTAAVVAGINITSTVQSGNGTINESLNPGDTATVNVNANDSGSGDSAQLARPRRGSGAPGSGPPSIDLLRAGPGRHVHAHAAPVVK